MKSWQTEALVHARAAYAQRGEACGLVVARDAELGEQAKRIVYRPCINRRRNAGEHFEIAAEDFAAAEDMGDVVGVFHSHPDASCHPSPGDRVACEVAGLPYYIVGLPDEVWGFCEPCGFALPLEGRPFVHGLIDCYSLVRDFYARERGIALPDFAREDDWWKAGGNLYVEHFAEAGFRAISQGEARGGDVLLMQVAAPVPNHAAILLERGLILHHVHGRLSERAIYRGYWRDHTTHVLRHHACDHLPQP